MTRETEQIKADAKLQEIRANLELQAANDQRDAEREVMKAQLDAEAEAQRLAFEKWKTEFTESNKIYIEQMKINGKTPEDISAERASMDQVMLSLQSISEHLNAPKTIIRDENGKAVGVNHGGVIKRILRDQFGKATGVQ